MDYLLIVVLGIAVFAVWRAGEDAAAQLRDQIKALEREQDWLRAQLAAHQKAHVTAPPTVAAAVAAPPQPTEAKQPAATHAPAPAAPRPPVQAVATPASAPPVIAQAALRPSPPVVRLEQPKPSPRPEPPAAPAAPPPVAPKPPVAPAAAFKEPERSEPVAEATPGGKFFSLEERLGANWLNKIGIALVVLAIAYFLASKFQTWGPAGKVLCGFAVSAALLAGGVWLERKETYRIIARGSIGGGWAGGFFTTFALYHLPAARVLDSLIVDLLLMLLVAAGMVAHSLRYRSQTVTGLAFLLGFATLLTSDLETGGGTVVFSLAASAVLALALVVVTTLRHWTWLELAGLIAVYLNHLVWLTQVLPENHSAFTEFWPSTALILLYWAIFRAAYVLRAPKSQTEENQSSLAAVLNSCGVLGLLKVQSAHPEWAFWALAAMGTVEMALAFRMRSRRRQAFVMLSTIATVLLVSAVPFKFHGVSWPVLWLVEAHVLAVCGLRLGEPVFRRLGLLAGVITGGVLAFHDVAPLWLLRLDYPDLGGHLWLTVALGMAAILYWVHAEVYTRRWPEIAKDEREAFALRITSWLGLAAAAGALWVALPDMWLPVGWLALVLLVGFAARRLGGVQLALEADVLALASGAVLALHHVGPLVWFRLDNPDPSRHWAETTVLALAALAYWVYAEAYPRLLPSSDSAPALESNLDAWQGFILPVVSWLGMAAAASALWVALPDLWVPVGWLALVLLVAFVARRLGGVRLTLEADVLALASAAVLAFHHVWPLVWFRLDNPDLSHHWVETTVLALAAAAYWAYAEAYPRLLPRSDLVPGLNSNLNDWQLIALPLASWLGTASAAAALWVALPAPWAAVGWLALVLLLGLVADWIKAESLALQADMLAVAALFGLVTWDLWAEETRHKAPLLAAVALLYAGMRRKTVLAGSRNYVAPAYSWAAAILLAILTFRNVRDVWIAPVLIALSLALFEIGRLARKGFLRWQGYLLAGFAFADYFASDLWSAGPATPISLSPAGFLVQDSVFSIVNSLLLEVLILAAAGYWLLERTRASERCTRPEHMVGLGADALGTVSIAMWFAYRFPSAWVPAPGGEAWVTAIWAGMATVLLALAWLMRRRAFLTQAMALVVAVLARGLALDLFADAPPGFWHGPLFHLSVTAAILLAALVFAFRLRGPEFWAGSTIPLPPDLGLLLSSPEQVFFFAAFALEVVALAVKLSSGHITIAWSLLGVGVFLFALIVGERSYRLAGLALLLVSVVKILLMDVWTLPLSDRWITFAVLGAALWAVSFLYTRFGSVIRKFL
jgi:uncharacterized membrane protein